MGNDISHEKFPRLLGLNETSCDYDKSYKKKTIQESLNRPKEERLLNYQVSMQLI